VGKSLSYQARREVLQQVAPQYREASSSQKRTLLDAFVATTGYHRTYARSLLNHAEEVQQTHGRSQLRTYGPDVQNTSRSQRSARSQLLAMSAATADRLLASQRKQSQRGLSTTRAGTLLKQQIPIRTFQEWKEARPGLLEAERARSLWRRYRGRLPVHLDTHRCSHRLDGVLAPFVP
jgi:hypothetical protein